MSTINLTDMNDITNPMQIYTAVDTWSNNLLTYAILVTIMVVVFVIAINRQYKFFSAMSISLSSLLIFNFLFWIGQILPPTWLITNIVLLAVSLFLVKFTE